VARYSLCLGRSRICVCATCRATANPPCRSVSDKTGVYHYKGWRYVYEIAAPGTPSECRTGRLFLGDREMTGTMGQTIETTGPAGEILARFAYFGAAGYNRGWLNTVTSDQAVFEQDTITFTYTAKKLLFRCAH
jgi:hypothetical protein